MGKIALVTDSTASLTPALRAEYGVHVIPLYVHFGTETYRDGVNLDTETFYRLLADSPTLPTTSQPSIGEFVTLYRRLAEEAEAIISIHISSGISGTVTAAEMARQAVMEELEHPPRIYVVDSRITSVGMALLITAAGRAIAAGKDAETIVREVEALRERLKVVFAVDTLTYLYRGGRIGGAAALVGSMLQIRPLLYFREGKIDLLEKARTTRRARQRMVELAEQWAGGRPIRAAIVHANAPGPADALRIRMIERFDCRELFVLEFSPVIATHVGPGTVGVALYPVEEA